MPHEPLGQSLPFSLPALSGATCLWCAQAPKGTHRHQGQLLPVLGKSVPVLSKWQQVVRGEREELEASGAFGAGPLWTPAAWPGVAL